jgi:hypothetical protein
MSSQEYLKLAEQFAQSWTGNFRLPSENITAQNFTGHLLAEELVALTNGESASLPFLTPNAALWITIAPDAENLEMAIEDLRAWVLPSFGWEDEKSSIVLPADSPAAIRNLISVVSPAGYFRWWTNNNEIGQTVGKLRTMRHLADSRPKHTYLHVPSLFELRQQYEVALLVKDEPEAQKVVDSINYNQLDTAANTGFMQIRLWSEFHEFEKIINHPQLRELLNLRMPQNIRLDFVKAFHAHFLQEIEERNDFAGAKQSYQENVAPLLDGLLALSRPSDGLAVSHCLGYKSISGQDAKLATELLEQTSDDFLQNLLKSFRAETVAAPDLSLADQFQVAHQKSDWRALQLIGSTILFDTEIKNEELPSDYIIAILWFSLNSRANPELQEKLHSIDFKQTSAEVPQTWLQFAVRIREKQWQNASAFLSLEDRPTLENTDLATALQFLETFEELFTDPDMETESVGKQILQSALPAIIREFLTAPDFPNEKLVSVYQQLMELWSIYKSGSSSSVDANLLLTLAEPVLQNAVSSENFVADILRQWWEARKVRALLPFLLSSLEILSENLTKIDICKNLWIDGADFVRLNPESLSPTERYLWRTIGGKLGFDIKTITEFFGTEVIAEEVDVLSNLQADRVSIVSLQIESAQNAAELIRQRTLAEVIVVSETHNNSAVENAKNSDIILFVWASNTHAVYRAFDHSREKLVYVQGKGASSIVISLERWAMTR